jgi:hypothetical protein
VLLIVPFLAVFRGDMLVFFENPSSAAFMASCTLLIVGQLVLGLRAALRLRAGAEPAFPLDGAAPLHNE